MIYVFKCVSKDHQDESTRRFEEFVHGIPKDKVVNTIPCKECGGLAKRDFADEIKTQAVVGLTPISHATTVKGSLFHDTKFAFGEVQKNPDGTEDKNHPRFRDSGELQRYMDGANTLGDPVLNDRGEPVKNKEGVMLRRGAKLFKYAKGATPSKDGVSYKPAPKAARWVSDREASSFGNSRGNVRGNIYNG